MNSVEHHKNGQHIRYDADIFNSIEDVALNLTYGHNDQPSWDLLKGEVQLSLFNIKVEILF